MSGELADMDGDRAYSEGYSPPGPRRPSPEEDFGAVNPKNLAVTPAERIADLEQAVMDLSELVRHMGQVLSWSSAGQELNRSPQYIRDCQTRLQELHSKLDSR